MPENTVAEVQAKEAAYEKLHGQRDWNNLTTACDLWTWAFFAPLIRAAQQLVPTSGTVRQMIESGTVPGNVIGAARAAAEQVGFFHWRLAFPDVFGVGDGGGFDAVLGNPPWERVKLTEKEFFEALDHVIADAPNKAARDRLIKRLPRDRPEIAQAFDDAKRTAENASLFMRLSERFPLTGRGDVNLYSVFTEQFRTMLAASGQCGIIVPTGIATDNTNKQLFSDLVFRRCLVAVYGFENEEMVFPGVHHAFKFALVTISGKTLSIPPVFVFFARQAQQIYDESRRFTLSPDDFALLNPNTRTCPIFRTARDAELTKAIYRAAPVLIDKSKGEEGNPWGVTFKTIFHMSNDSHLFHTREELERDGAHLDPDGYFRRAGDQWLPLYESKMIHQFDHRFGTYEGQTEAQARQGKLPELTELDHKDPNRVALPSSWVTESEVRTRWGSKRGWLLGFRDITNSTSRRTAIFTAVPFAAVGNSLPLISLDLVPTLQIAALLANLNSLSFDYVARQKIGGIHLNFFLLEQLPVLPPDNYTEGFLDIVRGRVLELTYTAHNMAPFARDLGYDGPPFVWDEERRARLRAELDGIYAHLYGISRDDFAYILDTFPIVARKDIDKYGEYRTKRLCLEAYDHFSPATLRALNEEVHEIEQALRRLIVTALGNDADALPSELREAIMAEWLKHRPDRSADDQPSLRSLLESAYLSHLDRLIRSDAVWPSVQGRFESRSQFNKQFGRLNSIRNPLAHGRSVDESLRQSGEEAVAWFKERLRIESRV